MSIIECPYCGYEQEVETMDAKLECVWCDSSLLIRVYESNLIVVGDPESELAQRVLNVIQQVFGERTQRTRIETLKENHHDR